ncbi:MAG: hypothetical protein ACOCRK_10915 [bacterium]
MIRKYLTLASRIEGEFEEIKKLKERIEKAWQHVERNDDDLYLDSVALNLHGFYSALEKIFQLIAQEIDGTVPESASWHQDLLLQMKTDIKKIRPAVISIDTYQKLEDYRGFRHIVRNVYTFNLSEKRVKPLIEDLDILIKGLGKEIEIFIEFLEEIGEE